MVADSRACGLCGKDPAEGLASITNGKQTVFYCHEGESPTCYEQAQWGMTSLELPW